MKLSYGKAGLILFLMVFSFLALPTLSNAADNDASFIVQNLTAEDIPNDDGGGLVLSWKPLSKEKRIIEYRVYRGASKDSLFFHGKVDVNVKTGSSGDVVYFYDSGYNRFVDLQSPGKLKKEDQQSDSSPLYQRYPRDINVTGPILKNYRILGVIPQKDFYYRNKKVEVEEDGESQVYAGLKIRHFSGLYKKLKVDKKYYYTVLAVTESRSYKPYCEPIVGIPRDNSPEITKKFYSVFLKDEDKLQFEWTRALFDSDHSDHSIYMIHKDDLAKFNNFIEVQKLIEENVVARKEDPEVKKIEQTHKNPAQLIFRRYCGYPYTPNNTVSVKIEDGKIIDTEQDINIAINTKSIEDYYFTFSLSDRAGNETFSAVTQSKIMNADKLPKLPKEWNVTDRKNDKGDYNSVYWGKPSVFLTNSTYLNDEKTKLLVNYEIYKNSKYNEIKNVYFKIYNENGELIDTINEFYQDKKLKVVLDKPSELISFNMTIRANGEYDEDHVFQQDLVFNPTSKSLQPGKLYLNDTEVNKYKYSVYKRNYSNQEWRLSKSSMGSQREIHDNIGYRLAHFKSVSKFDAEKQMFLVSPGFTIRMDKQLKNSIRANLYPSEAVKSVEQYQKEIDKYTAMKDTMKTRAEKASADEAIEYYKSQLDLVNHPILERAASIKNKKSRLKYLEKARRIASRSFEYKLLLSDGKAGFTESEVYTTNKKSKLPWTKKVRTSFTTLGSDHFFPLPNWFQNEKFPALIATLIFGILVFFMIREAKKGKDLYVRPIAGIEEIDNAIGRATEMGKPILFVPGLSGISDVATLAGLSILGRVAKKAAEYDTKILVPVRNYIVLPIAQEIVKQAHYEAGRPDTYDKNSAFFITTSQFAFVAGVNGIMVREKTATNFYMGMFWAEALVMTETGSTTGAIQISGTDAVTQIPFFITTCDYTLIGEELYAASAYLAREPLQLGTLKAVDYFKFIILAFIIVGTILSTTHATFLINAFPEK